MKEMIPVADTTQPQPTSGGNLPRGPIQRTPDTEEGWREM